ncbi:MAG: hypothetical protein AAFR44_00525 [Pseudomonadota bacterium]
MPELWDFAPLEPVIERLDWLTRILPGRGAEQRVALRGLPREVLVLRCRLDQAGRAEAIQRLRRGSAGKWTVPVWGRIGADGSLVNREAVLTGQAEVSRERRGRSVVALEFTLDAAADDGASPFAQYLGSDVVTDAHVLRQAAAEGVSQVVSYIDSGVGPIVPEIVRSYVQEPQTLSFVDHGHDARLRRRRWLYTIRGRQRAFWLPSWGGELVLQGDVGSGATVLSVAAVGNPADLIGRHVMIDLPGAPIFRRIDAASDAGGGVYSLTIAALGAAVPAATLVHLMTLVRLDTDQVEMRHLTTRTETVAPVVEVPA